MDKNKKIRGRTEEVGDVAEEEGQEDKKETENGGQHKKAEKEER